MKRATPSSSFTVERSIEIRRAGRGQRPVENVPAAPPVPVDLGRVPRISRLLALALRMERLIEGGEIRDYSELARLGGVTTARMTQVMSLLLLAPDLQEEILFLPKVVAGRDPIPERPVFAVLREMEWDAQRRTWDRIRGGEIVADSERRQGVSAHPEQAQA